jgi:hypothetical protein
MNDCDYLGLELNFWDDNIGAFEPEKVVRQILRVFPQTQVDPTDHQEVRLQRELAFWAEGEREGSLRDNLIRQSKRCYRTNGPTYRFQITLADAFQVTGTARRLSVAFHVPKNAPAELREQLWTFLRSLHMGKPMLRELTLAEDGSEDETPNG